MYLYNFGYGSYEESEYVQMWHEKKFTQEEFDDIVHRAIIKVCESLREHFKDGYHEDCNQENFHFVLFSSMNGGVRLQDIHDAVAKMLCSPEFGFNRVEFAATWDGFGWGGITDPSEEHGVWTNPEVAKSLPEDLRQWLIKMGEDSERRMKADMDEWRKKKEESK